MNTENKSLETKNEPCCLTAVSGSATAKSIITEGKNTTCTTNQSGYFTDNYRSYYVDENGKKYCR